MTQELRTLQAVLAAAREAETWPTSSSMPTCGSRAAWQAADPSREIFARIEVGEDTFLHLWDDLMRLAKLCVISTVMAACGGDSSGPTAAPPPPPPPPPSLAALDVMTVRQTPTGDDDIWIMDDDGLDKRDISGTGDRDQAPAWARDGSAVFFGRGAGLAGVVDIWRMNPDGSGQTQLSDVATLSGGSSATSPDHHPTGGILFHGNSAGTILTSIWKMAPDGSNPQRLTTASGIGHAFPRWSADGSRITWQQRAFPANGPSRDELWVMNSNGSGQLLLAEALVRHQGWDWHPSANRLALVTDIGGAFDIWLVPADGSAMTQLTTGANAADPQWSADGSKIAYRDVDTNAIFIINSDGSNPVPLGVNGTGPKWSADGSRLAYCAGAGLSRVGVDGENRTFVDANGGACASSSYRP